MLDYFMENIDNVKSSFIFVTARLLVDETKLGS